METWTTGQSLRVHMESVAACMGAYAEQLAPDERDRWIVAGLLHDFDYEKHPTETEHPYVGVQHLRDETDVDEEIIDAILGHADYTGTARTSAMSKALFAVDELAGFIVACAKVRPNGIGDMGAKSVKKKLKDKRFAEAVSRDDIATGVTELDVDLTEHIQRCIAAIQNEAERLEV